MKDDIKKKLYRYEDEKISHPFYLATFIMLEFDVVKETPKGYWISLYYSNEYDKFVRKDGKNIFAWDTKEKALFNYRKRKERQIKILKSRLKDAEARLNLISTKRGYVIWTKNKSKKKFLE